MNKSMIYRHLNPSTIYLITFNDKYSDNLPLFLFINPSKLPLLQNSTIKYKLLEDLYIK